LLGYTSSLPLLCCSSCGRGGFYPYLREPSGPHLLRPLLHELAQAVIALHRIDQRTVPSSNDREVEFVDLQLEGSQPERLSVASPKPRWSPNAKIINQFAMLRV
jgi:hypothetical protein